MIQATVIADSISTHGKRITTFSLVYPRFILAELNTHRMLSRNSASSRAIPTKKLLDEIKEKPAEPVAWGRNKPGMQADELLTGSDYDYAKSRWYFARDHAVIQAEQMALVGVHKQIVNRVLEPFMHARTVVTATEWDNFFKLRRHRDAQPEIKVLADEMWAAMQNSRPICLLKGEWHCPYYRPDSDDEPMARLHHSVARCARVSFANHEGKESTYAEDISLSQRLASSGHWSPFEHQATPIDADKRSNNFLGWRQHRKSCEKLYARQADSGQTECSQD